MRMGMIGLGRMGANMVRRLVKGGHDCVAYDRSAAAVQTAVAYGARAAESLDELVRALLPCLKDFRVQQQAALTLGKIGVTAK